MRLINGDCLKEMEKIKDKSVDLVLIDPPYNIKKAEWDSWKTVDEYVKFMGQVFNECQRVLKENGSFYFFHNDFLQIVELQNYINKNTDFNFNSFIIWDKKDFRALSWKNPSKKSNLRSWFNTCEYCLYYTFQNDKTDINNFKTLREYFKTLQKKIKLNKKEIIQEIGQRADHCFRWNSSQWDLPTEETYNELIKKFNIDKFEEFKEYEELREEYEGLRYTHNLDNNHNNIWYSKYSNSGKLHPTQKPLDILERIIKTSSNEGDIILDCFMGSGSTGVACVNTNRDFIGIELDKKYFKIAEQRIKEAQQKEVN